MVTVKYFWSCPGKPSTCHIMCVLIAFLSDSRLHWKIPQSKYTASFTFASPGLTPDTGLESTLPCFIKTCFLLFPWTTHQAVVSDGVLVYFKFFVGCPYIPRINSSASVFLSFFLFFISSSSIIINYFTQGPEENSKLVYLSIRILESSFFVAHCDSSAMKRLSIRHSRFRLFTSVKIFQTYSSLI